jgi:uncharacterized RDD family membrane protein YckC
VGTFDEAEPRAAGSAAVDSTEVVGRRIGALIVDSVLFAVVFVVIGLVTGGGSSGHGHVGVRLSGGGLLLYLLVWYAYFTICEGATGQTLGKRMLGIRVVSEDGGDASFGQAATRNLLRLVDALPVLYIVGLVSVYVTGQGRRQRVGDIAARTRVVSA